MMLRSELVAKLNAHRDNDVLVYVVRESGTAHVLEVQDVHYDPEYDQLLIDVEELLDGDEVPSDV